MSIITPQQLEMLLPLAVRLGRWARTCNRPIGRGAKRDRNSQTRDESESHSQSACGLLRVAQIPVPTAPALAAAARATNLINPLTHGLTFRYGIFIRADCWNHARSLYISLSTPSQYERLGGFEGFLRPYLLECITPPGYPYGPMEQEAVTTAAKFCANQTSGK